MSPSSSASPLRIGIILASVRPNRRGENYATWFQGILGKREGVEIELLDLRDYNIPPYAYAETPTKVETTYTDPTQRAWSEKIHALDGFVVVTPEYNHSFPGQLKNALDHVQLGWFYKPIAFVSYGGTGNGARAVEQLRLIAVELRMVPVRTEVNLRIIGLQVDDAGHPTDPIYERFAKGMIDQLMWWARTIKDARAQNAPPMS